MANNLLTGIRNYYKCDTNGTFTDSHGTDTGTINGATYNASGKLNGAYDYDGSNDRVDLYNASSAGVKTVSLWIKPNGTPAAADYVFGGVEAGTANFSAIRAEGGGTNYKLRISTVSGGAHVTSANFSLTNATYSHVVIQADASNYSITVNNGTPITGTPSGTITDLFDSYDGTVYVAFQGSSNNYRPGQIDEIGMWTRYLTSTEIASLYNSGNALSYDSFDSGDAAENAVLFGMNF